MNITRYGKLSMLAALLGIAGLWVTDAAAQSRARERGAPRVQIEDRQTGREAFRPTRARQAAPATPEEPETEAALAERMNANTVAVVSGTPGGTHFRMASDMAFVLDDGFNLRILNVLGKGAGQNAYDVRFLKGVDLGFVRTDTLDQLRQDKRLRNIEQHMAYIAKLYNDELHVIASRDVKDVRELVGKKVSFDVKGSGTDYSGRSMFQLLGLEVEALNIDQPTAFEMLRRGELAAVVSVAAKPVAVVAGFDPGDRFHFLNVPYVEAVADKYVPATLTSAEYPKLVGPGETVNTLAVGTILGVYNWPRNSDRYNRIARFVDAFFSNFDKFLEKPRHPKWREVNIAAGVPGWQRFRAAEEWLDNHPPADTVASQTEFKAFLNEQSPAGMTDKDRLYAEYLKWRRERGLAAEPAATGTTR